MFEVRDMYYEVLGLAHLTSPENFREMWNEVKKYPPEFQVMYLNRVGRRDGGSVLETTVTPQ